jgi:hypothetical protein
MFEQTFETSATPHVTVAECLDNLVVRGSQDRRVTLHVKGSADDVTMEREGETFTLTAHVGCFLTCPPATTLTVDGVQGNLKIERVEGPVTVGTAHGNVALCDVGPAALDRVFGNLSVRRVTGDLRVQTVRGNARVRQVAGALSLGHVDGNLASRGAQGGLTAEQVRGNVRLGPPFSPGMTYRLNADGNLDVRLPASASLRLALQAGDRVRSSVPDLVLEEADGEMRGVLGAGEASLEAQVDGHVSLWPFEAEERSVEGFPFDFAADLEGLGAQIEARIAEAMAEMETRLEESLGRIEDPVLRQRVEQEAAYAMQKAEQTAQQARRKAEREAERARLRAERAERRWRRVSGERPHSRRELATDEERMRVLRMVEAGKITPAQAADLLAALEGQ